MGTIFGKESVAEPSYKVMMTSTKGAGGSRGAGGTYLPYEIRQYGDRYAVQTIYPINTSTGIPFRKLAKYIGVFGTPNNIGTKSIDMTSPVAISSSTTTPSSTKNSGGASSETTQAVPIAMTAPVSVKVATSTTSDKKSGTGVDSTHQVMTFYLPSIYNEHPTTIPKPIDADVTILCVPGAIGAVHRFSGCMDDPSIARKKAYQLRQQLCDDGIATFGSTTTTTGSNTQEEDNIDTSFYETWQYNPPFTIPAFRRNEIWMELTKEQFQEVVDNKQQREKEESELN